MIKTTRRTLVATLALVTPGAPLSAPAAPIQDDIALGDSMAFGETDFSQNPCYGDRGDVKPFADSLGAQNGGVRPDVINLGVDAEISSTFFNDGPQGHGTLSGEPTPQLNLNYSNPATTEGHPQPSHFDVDRREGAGLRP